MGRKTCAETDVLVVIDRGRLEPGTGPIARCVEVAGTSGDGVAALQATGVSVTGSARFGNTFVCRIDGRPGARERLELPGGERHRESCADTPPASAYWSYWHAAPGTCKWTYSTSGATTRTVPEGSAEGWSFTLGDAPGEPSAPRLDPCERRETGMLQASSREAAGSSSAEGESPGRIDPLFGVALLLTMAAVAFVVNRRRRDGDRGRGDD